MSVQSKRSTSTGNAPRMQRGSLLALEPRMMFDAAALVTAAETIVQNEPTTAPESVEIDASFFEALAGINTEADFFAVEEQARDLITGYLSHGEGLEKLLAIFHGNQAEPSAQWLARAETLYRQILGNEYAVAARFVGNDQIPGVTAAFAAQGPGGQPTIFINGDWWREQTDPSLLTRVLIEEYGHSFDHFLNPGEDTLGDEGEAFAAAVLDLPLNFIDKARIAIQNDHATLVVDGQEFAVETANFNFINAYEVTNEADKETNRHEFDSNLPLGAVRIVDTVDSRYFSGNDVSAVGIVVNGETHYGWISRPIKANGIVRGFYFWTDRDFVDLAAAQADGNADGDRNVADNRGFLLVLDQAYFDSLKFTEGAFKSVGSSSDKVDAALNAQILPNGAPLPNHDFFSGDQGLTIIGNVLNNDTDPNNDPLRVTQFVVAGQTHAAGQSATIDGIGTLGIAADGTLIFVPLSGFTGQVPTLTYTLSDGELSATAMLSILVNAVNAPPTSTHDSLTIESGAATLLSLSDFGDYSDPNHDPLAAIRITALPTVGTLEYRNNEGNWVAVQANDEISAAHINAGRLRYTPSGTTDVAIGFAVSDGRLSSLATYTLEITVNEGQPNAPDITAVPAREAGDNENGSTAAGTLLPGGSNLALTTIGGTPVASTGATVIQGQYGTLTVAADGGYTYAPDNHHPAVDALNAGDTLRESFTYTIANAQGATASARLFVSIEGTNDAPLARLDAAALKELAARHADGHYGRVTGNVLTNDSDVDSQNLEVVIGDSDVIVIDGDPPTIAYAISPINSAATVFTATLVSGAQLHNNNGGFSTLNEAFNVVLAASPGTPLKASDGVTNLLVWRISGTGNNARLGFNDPAAFYSFPAGTQFGAVDLSGQKTITSVFTVAVSNLTLAQSAQITLTTQPATPIQVGYLVSDGGVGIPSGTRVGAITNNVITLVDANNNPVLVQISNRALTFSDPHAQTGGTLSPSQGEMLLRGAHGYLSLKSDGSYTYTLTDNSLNAGQTATETFTYRATDGTSLSAATTLTFSIDGTSAATSLQVVDDQVSVDENSSVQNLDLFANDTDAVTLTGFRWGNTSGTVGSPLTIPGVGELTLTSDGRLSFTPAPDYRGSVPVITYTAMDSQGLERDSAIVSILINPVNAPPRSTHDVIAIALNSSHTLTPGDFGEYSDANGDPLHSVRITSSPVLGTLEYHNGTAWVAVAPGEVISVQDLAAGKLRYTPGAGATAGNHYAEIGFKVNDGTDDSLGSYILRVDLFQPAAPPVNFLPGELTTPNYESLSIGGLSVDDLNDDITRVTLSVAGGTLTVTDGGSDQAPPAAGNGSSTLVLTGDKGQINAMLATLVYLPDSGTSGEDTLRIHTVDATNRSATDFVAIHVTADSRALTVTGTSVNEASPYLRFQVAGEAGQRVSLELAETGSGAGHAVIGQDVLPFLEYFDGTQWQSYSGGLVAIPEASTSLLVRVAVLQDALDEGVETLKLIAANSNQDRFEGIGAIRDDAAGDIFLENNTGFDPNAAQDNGYPAYLDDDRSLGVNHIAVNEASPYAVFNVQGHGGQVIRLHLQEGTATLGADFGPGLQVYANNAWTDYTPGTDLTIAAGGTLLVRTAIVNDAVFEGQEGFSLGVTRPGSGETIHGIAGIFDDGTGDIHLSDNSSGDPNQPGDAAILRWTTTALCPLPVRMCPSMKVLISSSSPCAAIPVRASPLNW